jgi:hypothetical protein
VLFFIIAHQTNLDFRLRGARFRAFVLYRTATIPQAICQWELLLFWESTETVGFAFSNWCHATWRVETIVYHDVPPLVSPAGSRRRASYKCGRTKLNCAQSTWSITEPCFFFFFFALTWFGVAFVEIPCFISEIVGNRLA